MPGKLHGHCALPEWRGGWWAERDSLAMAAVFAMYEGVCQAISDDDLPF